MSCSENLRRRLLGAGGALGTHSCLALMQLEQGFWRSHFTFLCAHKMQEWPRVILGKDGTGPGPGISSGV